MEAIELFSNANVVAALRLYSLLTAM